MLSTSTRMARSRATRSACSTLARSFTTMVSRATRRASSGLRLRRATQSPSSCAGGSCWRAMALSGIYRKRLSSSSTRNPRGTWNRPSCATGFLRRAPTYRKTLSRPRTTSRRSSSESFSCLQWHFLQLCIQHYVLHALNEYSTKPSFISKVMFVDASLCSLSCQPRSRSSFGVFSNLDDWFVAVFGGLPLFFRVIMKWNRLLIWNNKRSLQVKGGRNFDSNQKKSWKHDENFCYFVIKNHIVNSFLICTILLLINDWYCNIWAKFISCLHQNNLQKIMACTCYISLFFIYYIYLYNPYIIF